MMRLAAGDGRVTFATLAGGHFAPRLRKHFGVDRVRVACAGDLRLVLDESRTTILGFTRRSDRNLYCYEGR